jgi:hypothetical protein
MSMSHPSRSKALIGRIEDNHYHFGTSSISRFQGPFQITFQAAKFQKLRNFEISF